jgi:hypothetical protein
VGFEGNQSENLTLLELRRKDSKLRELGKSESGFAVKCQDLHVFAKRKSHKTLIISKSSLGS